MKNIYNSILTLMASASFFVSCADGLVNMEESGQKPYGDFVIRAGMDETKTFNDGLKTGWEETDAIHVFHQDCDGTVRNDGKFTIIDAGEGLFTGVLDADIAAGATYNVWAVYPYSGSNTNPALCTFMIGGKNQYQNGVGSMEHLAGETVPLYGHTVAKGGEMPQIAMKNLSTVLSVAIVNDDLEDLVVRSMTLKTPEDVAGGYNVNLTGENVVYSPLDATSEVTLDIIGGNMTIASGEEGRFFFVLKPFKLSVGQTFTVFVNDRPFVAYVKADKEFQEGMIVNVPIRYKSKVYMDGAGALGWGNGLLECPVTNNADGTYTFDAKLKDGAVALLSCNMFGNETWLVSGPSKDFSAGGTFDFEKVSKTEREITISDYWNDNVSSAGRYRFTVNEKTCKMKVEKLITVDKCALNGSIFGWSEVLPEYTYDGNTITFVCELPAAGNFAIYGTSDTFVPADAPRNVTATGWSGSIGLPVNAGVADFFNVDVPGKYRFVIDYENMSMEIRPADFYLTGPGLKDAGGYEKYIRMSASSSDIAVYVYNGEAVQGGMITLFSQEGKGQLIPDPVGDASSPNYSLGTPMGIHVPVSGEGVAGFWTSDYESGIYAYTVDLRKMTFTVNR